MERDMNRSGRTWDGERHEQIREDMRWRET